jgi:hypothetical protein
VGSPVNASGSLNRRIIEGSCRGPRVTHSQSRPTTMLPCWHNVTKDPVLLLVVRAFLCHHLRGQYAESRGLGLADLANSDLAQSRPPQKKGSWHKCCGRMCPSPKLPAPIRLKARNQRNIGYKASLLHRRQFLSCFACSCARLFRSLDGPHAGSAHLGLARLPSGESSIHQSPSEGVDINTYLFSLPLPSASRGCANNVRNATLIVKSTHHKIDDIYRQK